MITPSRKYAHARYRKPPKLHKGLDARLNALHGLYRRRPQLLRKIREQAETIDREADDWHKFKDSQLRNRLFELRDRFRRTRETDDDELVNAALGALREAAHRKLGLRPYNVQLMGALALNGGFLAEMATGEGKTLTAGLAAVLNGWTNRPCHIITVNDYLVERDCKWMSPLYDYCGITSSFVTGGMEPQRRQEGYAADVTYTTAKEVLADFLRDRLQAGLIQDPSRRLIRHLLGANRPGRDEFILRGLHTAIVDEADSVLIDEAVTPLIISSQRANQALTDASNLATEISGGFQIDIHYRLNIRYREVEFTKAGLEMIDEVCQKFHGLWRNPQRCEELIRQSLLAREFYKLGKQYIVEDEKIVIVDEFTGRPMPMRSWQQGIHQAVEAKEELEISDPTETVARRSFQRFFRYFHKLSGMTGTAREASAELWQIYNLPVVTIPTNRPCIREEKPDRVFLSADAKWKAVVEEVQRVHATGQPVLVGTRSVVASEKLASMLAEKDLRYNVLNASRLRKEAEIIAEAGREGCITIATNMAGRGTDIKLGVGVADFGGLHVIATERHESGRIDRQLFGRCARQGDPGSCQAFVSADDEIIKKYLSEPEKKMLRTALVSRRPGAAKLFAAALVRAQRKSERTAAKQRRAVLRKDVWLEQSLSFAGGGED